MDCLSCTNSHKSDQCLKLGRKSTKDDKKSGYLCVSNWIINTLRKCGCDVRKSLPDPDCLQNYEKGRNL